MRLFRLKKDNDRLANSASLAVILVSFLCSSIVWGLIINLYAKDGDYGFRIMALLPLISGVLNTTLVILLAKRIQHSETGAWFLLHISTLIFWSFCEFMQRISFDLETANFWRSVAVFGWVSMPMFYLFFAMTYVEKVYYMRRILLQLGMLGFVIGIIFAQLRTDLIVSNNYKLETWGYDSVNNGLIDIFTLWFISLFAISAILLVQDYRKTLNKSKRRQLKIFLFCLLIPVIGGTFTDVILPSMLGINSWPLAATLTGTAGIILSIAIYKYGLFNLNPASISAEVIETMPQPVIGTDNKFEIQFMNEEATKIFSQYAPFKDKSIKDLIGNENFNNITEAIFTSGNKQTITIDKIPLGLEKGVFITKANIRALKQGGIKGYIISLSDITQQILTMNVIEREVKIRTQLYNQERARLMASVNGLRQGFLIVDDKKKINLMNKKAQKMFPDIKVSNVQSGHVVDGSLISSLDKYLVEYELEKKLEEAISTNKYVVSRDIIFNEQILDIEVTPIVVGEDSIGAVVLLDDVTEATMMERSKDEFFSIASHELRTPLTAIRGNTSMILDYYKEDIKDDEMKEMLRDIHDSSQRLIEIVNDFLDTSRLEQGRMEFNLQKTSLQKIIEAVVKDTVIVAKEQGDDIKIDPAISNLPEVYADPDKLKQVVYNLIGNSIKFTRNGKIRISGVKEDDSIRLTVIDEGRGIGEESRKLLFRKFQQASSSILTRDTTKGTGLGLYISKMLLEKMNGSIRLDSSEPGKGSVFSFTIPIAKQNNDEQKSIKKSIPEE